MLLACSAWALAAYSYSLAPFLPALCLLQLLKSVPVLLFDCLGLAYPLGSGMAVSKKLAFALFEYFFYFCVRESQLPQKRVALFNSENLKH